MKKILWKSSQCKAKREEMEKKFQWGSILNNFVEYKWSSLLFPHKEGSWLPRKSFNTEPPFSFPLSEQKACWAEKRKPFITGNVPVSLVESRGRPVSQTVEWVFHEAALCIISHGDTTSLQPLGDVHSSMKFSCEDIWLTSFFFFFIQMWHFQGLMLINFFPFQKEPKAKFGP